MCGNARADNEVVSYNRLISKAELSIAGQDFRKGLAFYEMAFRLSGGRAFGTYLVHAFHCAMDCNDAKAREYLRMLLAKRVSSRFISKALISYYPGPDGQRILQWVAGMLNDTVYASEAAIVLHNMQGWERFTDGHVFDTILYKGVMSWSISATEFLNLPASSSYGYNGPDYFHYGKDTIRFPYSINVMTVGSGDSILYYLERYSPATEMRISSQSARQGLEGPEAVRKKWEFMKRQRADDPFGGKYRFDLLMGSDYEFSDRKMIVDRLKRLALQ